MALSQEKLIQKQKTLIARTAKALVVDEREARELLTIGRQQSLRINTLKGTSHEIINQLERDQIQTNAVSWAPEGLFTEQPSQTLSHSESVKAGSVYIQNAASWLPVIALDPKEDTRILDMCAAPGGKTSHIAQRVDNSADIVANDNSRPRLHRLQSNLSRLGVQGVTFTLYDATRLAGHLEPESFDSILLDAPCSGEGMMTLDDTKSFESWSVAHIKRLQAMQKRLVVQAWKLLKPGGTLVYSTCTMAPEENEAVIDYLLRHNDDIQVEPLNNLKEQLDNSVSTVQQWNDRTFDSRITGAIRLKPSVHIEAFFVIKLIKTP